MTGFASYIMPAAAAACFAVAAFVLSRNARSPVNWTFSLGSASLGLMGLSEFMAVSTADALFWLRVSMVAGAAMPVSWTLFSSTFARADMTGSLKRHLPLAVLFGAAYAALLAFIGTDRFLYIRESLSSGPVILVGRAGYIYHVVFLLNMIFILINLESTLRASAGVARWRIKYFIVGAGAIAAFHLFTSSHVLLYGAVADGLIPAKGVAIAVAMALVAVSLVRNRLLDTNVYVSRRVVYGSVTLIATGAYLLSVGLLGEAMRHLGGDLSRYSKAVFFFLALTALAVLLLSDKLKRTVRVKIDRHFYRSRYDYRTKWLEITGRLSSARSIEGLYTAILEAFRDTIGSKNASLWLYDRGPGSFDLACTVGLDDVERRSIRIGGPCMEGLAEREWIINLGEAGSMEGSVNEGDLAFLRGLRASLVVPLKDAESMVGVIILGGRIVEEGYRYEDYDILKTIARQAAASISNARLAEELARSREFEAFNRVSSFMMHDLKNLTHTLSLLSLNATEHMEDPEFRRSLVKTMNSTVEKMKGLMSRLSSVPGDGVGLNRCDTDVNSVVEDAAEAFAYKGGRGAVLVKELGPVPEIPIDREEMRRVVYNFLLNASEAVNGGGVVRVGTSVEGGAVKVRVSDNGCGMSKEFMARSLFRPFRTTKKKGFGIGLYQCKTIVEAHQGRIEVESEEGKGTTFTIVLPMDAGPGVRRAEAL